MRFNIILLFLLFLLFSLGCARTVTNTFASGTVFKLSAEFSQSLNLVDNRYFLIITTNEAFSLPQYPRELVEPGLPPKDKNISYDLYNYYQGWDAYVISDNSGNFTLVKGPFRSSSEAYSTYTRISLERLNAADNKISFSFRLDQAYGAAVPSRVYFDIVSVDKNNIIRDRIAPAGYSILLIQGEQVSQSESVNANIDATLDLKQYTVKIE